MTVKYISPVSFFFAAKTILIEGEREGSVVSLPRRAFSLERGALKNGAVAFVYLLGYVFSFILLCFVLFAS